MPKLKTKILPRRANDDYERFAIYENKTRIGEIEWSLIYGAMRVCFEYSIHRVDAPAPADLSTKSLKRAALDYVRTVY